MYKDKCTFNFISQHVTIEGQDEIQLQLLFHT